MVPVWPCLPSSVLLSEQLRMRYSLDGGVFVSGTHVLPEGKAHCRINTWRQDLLRPSDHNGSISNAIPISNKYSMVNSPMLILRLGRMDRLPLTMIMSPYAPQARRNWREAYLAREGRESRVTSVGISTPSRSYVQLRMAYTISPLLSMRIFVGHGVSIRWGKPLHRSIVGNDSVALTVSRDAHLS